MKKLKKYWAVAIFILKNEGLSSLLKSAIYRLLKEKKYTIFWYRYKARKRNILQMKEEQKHFKYRPKISVLMPVYNSNIKYLKQAIESVLTQIYQNIELCICNDASSDPKVKKLLKKYQSKEPQVKIIHHIRNKNISEALNSAYELSNGEYVALVDHDDKLAKNALFEVVKHIQKSMPDIIYTDEDKITPHGFHLTPFFKPDWSPELLMSIMYMGHLTVYRRSLLEKVGGFRKGYEGSQDYDLALRATEEVIKSSASHNPYEKILHIPKILYQWRKHKKSTAKEISVKSYTKQSAKKALKDSLRRRNIEGKVEDGLWMGSYRVKRKIKTSPLVSIIIPFRDQVNMLKRCLESIETKTHYKKYEILLVDNQSKEEETKKFLKALTEKKLFSFSQRTLTYDNPFNFSKINNCAAKKVNGEILLFLNNDTEVIEPNWLESMLEHIENPEIAIVGALLLYPNNTVQHAGVVLGIAGTCSHAFRHVSDTFHGYMGLKDVVRNVSAVTGACLMVSKEKFEKLGKFDERYETAYQDVDLCLRALQKGYRNVYTPFSKLYHHESVTRKQSFGKKDTEQFLENWRSFIAKGDPYYNTNLSLEREDFRPR
ncbi:glycosyltransferase family 2 protein [Candidatus Peregrinibacteria bacterium]|nr:glycosyltransferase family 2 protein [Candidatus Peregrinibacteria bacterium]